MFTINPGGHDFSRRINFDSLGQLYIGLAASWTILLVIGMAFLISNRKLSFLRMRNLPLGIAAVCTLHVYWILCMTVYTMNGTFPCDLEFWIMSIYLPFGIALYQANSTQLLHIAGLQRRFVTSEPVYIELKGNPKARGWRGWIVKWDSLNVTQRAIIGIAAGMAVQFSVSIFLFLISKRFHGSWGLVGHEVGPIQCRKGWEWWPSITWQFVWAWIYAPYLVYKIRGIEDVHGWRIQTIVCSVAGLLGSPMWLVALYAKSFKNIDAYWLAPQWFAPGICVMEACVIFVPCWQVMKSHKLQKETLDILAEWETKNNRSKGSVESSSTRSHTVRSVRTNATTSTRRSEMYTMQALEKALKTNPTPLLLFSALKDFSGENISFLNHVREWKEGWVPQSNSRFRKPNAPKPLDGETLRRRQFNLAVEIYSSFISMQYSAFPVNLSSAHQKELEAVFDGPASMVNAHVEENSATPFATWDAERGLEKDNVSVLSSSVSSDDFSQPSVSSNLDSFRNLSLFSMSNRLPADTPIPDNFGAGAFDNAEDSIKYMVLTNTWPKFVTAGYANSTQPSSFMANVKHRGALKAVATGVSKPFEYFTKK